MAGQKESRSRRGNQGTGGPEARAEHPDTVVGTVGEEIKTRQDTTGLVVTEFQLTTFGHPTEIQVSHTWEPGSNAGAEIKPEAVLRLWGRLDAAMERMETTRALDPWGEELKVLVCGGRNFAGWRALERALDLMGPDVIIHGAARGADSLAGRYARENETECRSFPAHWKVQDENGRWVTDRGAGHRRNQQMLDEGRPDLVVAFPGGSGTRNMVKISREQGFPVHIIDHRGARRRGNAPEVVPE